MDQKKRRLRIPKLDLRGFFNLLVESGKSWSAHRVPRMGAALSYYTAFSLAPLVVLILTVASFLVVHEHSKAGQSWVDSYTIFGYPLEKSPADYIVDEVTDIMGKSGGSAVHEIFNHAGNTHALSWSTAISLVILLVSASGAFGELQDSLNQIWGVTSKQNPFLVMIRGRALSFAMVFVLGFFMLVSLLLSTMISIVSHMVVTHFPTIGLEAANTLISFVVFTGLFCVIFRVLPDVPLRWSDVWPGALLSAVLFIIGKFLLGWYIGFSSTSFSRYGAAGSFVVILLWVFYSAQILFMGAEFSRAYTFRYGSLRGQKSVPVAS